MLQNEQEPSKTDEVDQQQEVNSLEGQEKVSSQEINVNKENGGEKNIEILDMQNNQADNDQIIGAKKKKNVFQIKQNPSTVDLIHSDRKHQGSQNAFSPYDSKNNTNRQFHKRSSSRPNLYSTVTSKNKKHSRNTSMYGGKSYSSQGHLRNVSSSNLISTAYGDDIWPIKSSAVMTHTVLNYSVPQGERFNSHQKSNSTSSMYNLNNTLGKKTCSFGIGNKGVFSRKWINDTGAKPEPGHYDRQSDFDKNNLSKSFGINHDAYKRVIPCGQPEFMSIEIAKKIPGPGTYKNFKEIGADKLKYSLYGKGKMMSQNIVWRSPGAIYNERHDLVEQRRYHGVGFGFSKKVDFTNKATAFVPGPGQYKLPTMFDKFFSK